MPQIFYDTRTSWQKVSDAGAVAVQVTSGVEALCYIGASEPATSEGVFRLYGGDEPTTFTAEQSVWLKRSFSRSRVSVNSPSAALPPVTLGTLSLTNPQFPAGRTYRGRIVGRTEGSTLSLTGLGAEGLLVSDSYIIGTARMEGPINIVETLPGAANSPRVTNNAGQITPAGGEGALTGTATRLSADGDKLVDSAGNTLIGTFSNDNPDFLLKQMCARKGILFGTSIQAASLMNAPGPAGFASRMDWLAANTDLFVPGFVMMPDVFNPSLGSFQMSAAAAFIADAQARGKAWRGHCAYYPKRDIGKWIDAHLQANPGQWQALQHARIDALAGVPGMSSAVNFDVINEVFSPGSANPGGWRTSPWTTAAGSFTAPAVSAFQKMRDVLPNVPRYWCQDASEQLASSTFNTHANNILAGIESCMNLGAPVDGYAMQAHLTFRLGFDNQSATRLRAFCRSLTETLGLKLIVSELDIRTGYGDGILDPYGQIDTRPPSGYTVPQYDQIAYDITKRFLDTVLPFVRSSGGNQLLSWTLDDGYNSWTEEYGQPPGERPTPYTSTFQPKPQLAAIRNAIVEC